MTLILMTLIINDINFNIIPKYSNPNISGICKSDNNDFIFTISSSMG